MITLLRCLSFTFLLSTGGIKYLSCARTKGLAKVLEDGVETTTLRYGLDTINVTDEIAPEREIFGRAPSDEEKIALEPWVIGLISLCCVSVLIIPLIVYLFLTTRNTSRIDDQYVRESRPISSGSRSRKMPSVRSSLRLSRKPAPSARQMKRSMKTFLTAPRTLRMSRSYRT